MALASQLSDPDLEPTSIGTPPSPTTTRGQHMKHATYYIPSGDVIFLVEDTLFRVHRYFFERESAVFRDMLSLPAPLQSSADSSTNPDQTTHSKVEGTSDETPIYLPQVSPNEFANFLWVFYNPTYYQYNAYALTWTSILKLAHRWEFPSVRALAFRELEHIPAVERVALGERYDAPADWRARALTELVMRREALSVVEGEQIGLEMVVKVSKMREDAQKQGRRWNGYDRSYSRSPRRRRHSRYRSRSPTPIPIVIPPEPVMYHYEPELPTIVSQPPAAFIIPPSTVISSLSSISDNERDTRWTRWRQKGVGMQKDMMRYFRKVFKKDSRD